MMRYSKIPLPEDMVLVPEGWFLMGCHPEEQLRDPVWGDDLLCSARPQRRVWLDAFLIDKFPVTNRQYKRFIDETGHPVPSWPEAFWWIEPDNPYKWDARRRTYPAGTEDLPVVLVSWYDAQAYCEWVGKRLPTEAEWEKAARGTDGRPYPWGWSKDFQHRCFLFRWQSEQGRLKLCPVSIVPKESSFRRERQRGKFPCRVGSFPKGRSPYGCWDMLGNVDEWCLDVFAEDFYRWMPERNPVHLQVSKEDVRVVRGCGRFADLIHVARRGAWDAWMANCGVGFRCAISLDEYLSENY